MYEIAVCLFNHLSETKQLAVLQNQALYFVLIYSTLPTNRSISYRALVLPFHIDVEPQTVERNRNAGPVLNINVRWSMNPFLL